MRASNSQGKDRIICVISCLGNCFSTCTKRGDLSKDDQTWVQKKHQTNKPKSSCEYFTKGSVFSTSAVTQDVVWCIEEPQTTHIQSRVENKLEGEVCYEGIQEESLTTYSKWYLSHKKTEQNFSFTAVKPASEEQHAHLCVQLLVGISHLANILLRLHCLPVKAWTYTKCLIYKLQHRDGEMKAVKKSSISVCERIFETTLCWQVPFFEKLQR